SLIYTRSLHDALPISPSDHRGRTLAPPTAAASPGPPGSESGGRRHRRPSAGPSEDEVRGTRRRAKADCEHERPRTAGGARKSRRSEEHTSELQSRENL